MKRSAFYIAACIAGMFLLAFIKHPSANGLEKGTPEIKSISALSFGPDGVLFIGDSKSATVFAVDTKDTKKSNQSAPIEMKNIDQQIAAALGTEAGNITITDMVVNPVSKKVYLSVQHSDG